VTIKHGLMVAALATVAIAVWILEPGQYLSLDYLKAQQLALRAYVELHPLQSSVLCFGIYMIATALSIPGAVAMTLAAGAVFGLLWGTLIVSFASTAGATLAFLMARYVLRDFVISRFGHRLEGINRGIQNDGPSYLLTLRLIPFVPFVGVNLLMALTPISARKFYLYSQIGMLPATAIFVNAGTQLASIEQLSDILSVTILISFGLLALFPFIAKLIIALLKRRRFRERFPPPPSVARNVVVIGAGSGGLVASLIAAAVRAKVTLIEQSEMGGDCLNTGCVPSKALLRVARQVHETRHAHVIGLPDTTLAVDFPQVMRRVQDVIRSIQPHDSVARFESLGVECIAGKARIVSPWEVEVNGRRLSTRSIILATGARPLVPQLPGLSKVDFLTSDTVWNLTEAPRRLVVLGGGPIGCELAQAFARLGATVTIVEMAERILPREDPEVSDLLAETFAAEHIRVQLNTRAVEFRTDEGQHVMVGEVAQAGTAEPIEISFDQILIALGRVANVEGYGLEELDIPLTASGRVDVNQYLQTQIPNIYACGDVTGPYQFTHVAAHQAWYASVNALFGTVKNLAVDYRVIPWCTFTDPEVARVGLSESEASALGNKFDVTRYELAELDRAIADGATRGFVKVITARGTDRILGATIVGQHAGDTIAEFVLAMKNNLGLNKILGTIHIYPTFADANKLVAGAWRRKHTNPRVLAWLQRWHLWRREGRSKPH